jgi:hypothetical protein
MLPCNSDLCGNTMKYKKYNTPGTFSKSNTKIIERGKIEF